MGSFGKKYIFHSRPFRHIHGQRGWHNLAPPHALQSFQLRHGAIRLPFQLGLITLDLLQHLYGWGNGVLSTRVRLPVILRGVAAELMG
jgi:hypothetical protein